MRACLECYIELKEDQKLFCSERCELIYVKQDLEVISRRYARFQVMYDEERKELLKYRTEVRDVIDILCGIRDGKMRRDLHKVCADKNCPSVELVKTAIKMLDGSWWV